MRRPCSSSCLLLPKESFDEADAVTADGSSANSISLSVTILSKESLPSYSSERFFLLAEIEVHAQPITFLCESGNSTEENSTQATEETEEDEGTATSPPSKTHSDASSPERGLGSTTISQHEHLYLPPCILLYLLWRPEMTPDPSFFAETYILDAVMRIKESVDLESSSSQRNDQHHESAPRFSGSLGSGRIVDTAVGDEVRGGCTSDININVQNATIHLDQASTPTGKHISFAHSISSSPTSASVPHRSHADASSTPTKASLYLVVDRVRPTLSSSETSHPSSGEVVQQHQKQQEEEEEDLAERLARAVASHPVLRQCTEGITVGLSNHVRAAPGLEACVQAVHWGSQDRRRHHHATTVATANQFHHQSSSTNTVSTTTIDPEKSLLGIVSWTQEDMLGLQKTGVTDAAEGVLQSKVTVEWNRQGDLHSFAKRAHDQWKRQHGIDTSRITDGFALKRKVPRRIQNRLVVAKKSNRSHLYAGTEVRLERAMHEQCVDFLAVCLILVFVLFHFGSDVAWSFRSVTTMWYDLIRSLR